MKSFNEYLQGINLEKFKEYSRCENPAIIENLLRSNFPNPGPETFALLSSPAASQFIEQMAQKAAALTAQRHGRVIRFYAPLYVSNECTNTCTYWFWYSGICYSFKS